MPYHSVSEVPDHVPKSKRKQWMEVWNSIYQETGDEGRAFAGANSEVKKFGTPDVGYVGAEFGPFNCGRCKYSEELNDELICTNEKVAEDSSVPEDKYSNKAVESGACCNAWEPSKQS